MSKKPAKDPGAPKVKSGSAGLIGLAILGAAAVATSFGVAFFMTPAPTDAVQACVAAPTGETEVSANLDQTYVPLEEMLITIGSAPATRYVKINLSIVTGPKGAASVKKNEPVLKDAFNNYLRSVEVSDFEDPGFYAHMREQLSRRSELVLGGSVSEGVLITEFLLR